jgi:hypothetical protein
VITVQIGTGLGNNKEMYQRIRRTSNKTVKNIKQGNLLKMFSWKTQKQLGDNLKMNKKSPC